MIERGYDIYYKTSSNSSLFTEAISHRSKEIVQKLLDIDTCFAYEFNARYSTPRYTKDDFYYDIAKYCRDKRDTYKREIIATMDDASPTNVLYQSFHTTYAIELVDIICDFILLQI
ncbi:MAG: hypothetical protein Faunusvirus13_5 [Faunusvirus sp.]|jgi:hypothetical protein|uniref:Uncharacterized protein n=1 Tax=Faunusvirus sp. TaxID=2487766 RepID=A0A3G4ZWX1_9VIRU|nr:MAG: hypothetical protein Faunusvirus13_5 [Faunusvirus sp.]